MTPGRLIAVVGPSGVGKDSVMQGVQATLPGLHLVRRVITRPPAQGGEVFDAVNETEFAALAESGAFAIWWRAHGLAYGIPISVQSRLTTGSDCLANLSRGALARASTVFPRLVVLHITARPDTIARRLAARGRESADEIAERLRTADAALPPGLDVRDLSNDGPLSETVARATALLQPMKAS